MEVKSIPIKDLPEGKVKDEMLAILEDMATATAMLQKIDDAVKVVTEKANSCFSKNYEGDAQELEDLQCDVMKSLMGYSMYIHNIRKLWIESKERIEVLTESLERVWGN